MNLREHEEFGKVIGQVLYGVSRGDLIEKSAKTQVLEESLDYKNMLCKLASTVIELSEGPKTGARFINLAVARSREGDLAASDLRDKIASTFQDLLVDEMVKDAAVSKGAGPFGAFLARLGLSATPEVIRSMLLAGAGVGVGGGAMHWLLNRDTTEDQQDLEEMRARIDTYNRMSREMSERMQQNGTLPEPPYAG